VAIPYIELLTSPQKNWSFFSRVFAHWWCFSHIFEHTPPKI